jgi:hypothetical protein
MTSRVRFIQTFIACGTALGLAVSRDAEAQVVRGEIAVGGGSATDQRGVHSSALTIAPSVLLAPDPRFSAALAASATQFGSNARALGGTATLGTRLPLGSVVAIAASAAGATTQTSFNASYSSAELTPTLEATVAGVTLFGGAHVASGSSSIRQVTSTPGGILGTPSAGTRDVTSSRTSSGAVFGGVLNIAGAPGTADGALSYREEHAHVAGVNVVDRVATGTVAGGTLALTASGGLRDAPDEQLGYGSLTVTLALGRAVALQGAVGTYPSNRVTGTFGGRFASVGLTLHGLRRLDSPISTGPKVRGVPAAPSGATRLSISAPSAQRVEVAGDWNKWAPTAAARAADGTWYADVRLAPGEHRYAFKLDGKRWSVPDGVPSVDDGFGGRSALVTVP